MLKVALFYTAGKYAFLAGSHSMQPEIPAIQCNCSYTSVFAQKQGSPIGEFSLHFKKI